MVLLFLGRAAEEAALAAAQPCSARCCWHLAAGEDKDGSPDPSLRTGGEQTHPCFAGLPGCLINSGTEEEKPAWSCLRVIKFLCRLSALISAA